MGFNITILETIRFIDRRTTIHIGKDENGIIYYGEENSRLQWMISDRYMNSKSVIKNDKIRNIIIKYQREQKINSLLK